jgi:hypothetical protein
VRHIHGRPCPRPSDALAHAASVGQAGDQPAGSAIENDQRLERVVEMAGRNGESRDRRASEGARALEVADAAS